MSKQSPYEITSVMKDVLGGVTVTFRNREDGSEAVASAPGKIGADLMRGWRPKSVRQLMSMLFDLCQNCEVEPIIERSEEDADNKIICDKCADKARGV